MMETWPYKGCECPWVLWLCKWTSGVCFWLNICCWTFNALIGSPTGSSTEDTSHNSSYEHSHCLHSGKCTLNTWKHLWTSKFNSEHLHVTLNTSELFHNTLNVLGRLHPTFLTFGYVSCTLPAPIPLSSNVLDTCPHDSMQVLKNEVFCDIIITKDSLIWISFSSYYIIIFWSFFLLISFHISLLM